MDLYSESHTAFPIDTSPGHGDSDISPPNSSDSDPPGYSASAVGGFPDKEFDIDIHYDGE